MISRKLLITLLVIHLGGLWAAASDFDDVEKWTTTRYGSTIVLRPSHSPLATKNERNATEVAKPIRIVGFHSLADFVDGLLGFQDGTQ